MIDLLIVLPIVLVFGIIGYWRYSRNWYFKADEELR